MSNQYDEHYDNESFLDKIRKTVGTIPFAEEALSLYFALIDEETPLWVKGIITGALGYFIFPFDAVPDVIPFLGFADDAAIIAAALNSINCYVLERHREQAKDFL